MGRERTLKIDKDYKRKVLKLVIAIGIISITLSSCSSSINKKSGGSHSKTEIVVFAAASLTECFAKIKEDYESENNNIQIVLNFAGSQVLKNQIEAGANPDMYFSANRTYPNELIQGGIADLDEKLSEGDIDIYAKNELVIICAKDKGLDLEGFIDTIIQEESTIVLAHGDVPVGKYTMNMMEALKDSQGDSVFYDKFYEQVVSYENDVKAVLAKIKMKEADFGIVYGTDAIAASDSIYQIEIASAYNQQAVYGSLLLNKGEAEQAFYHYIIKGAGQETLAEFGFVTN